MVLNKPGEWQLKFLSLFLIGLIIFLPLSVSNSAAMPAGNSSKPNNMCSSDSDCLEYPEYYCDYSMDGLINDKCCPFGTEYNFFTNQCTGICIDNDNDGYGQYGDYTCKNKGTDCDDNNPDVHENCIEDNNYENSSFEDYSDLTDEEYEQVCLKDQCFNGDNDCDGNPDIGCVSDSCTNPSEEICNNKDDDCDGVIDDGCISYCNKCGKDKHWYTFGLGNLCDKEECRKLGSGCEYNNGECIETINLAEKCIPEVCNGIDDDCDNLVDEECYPEEPPMDVEAFAAFATIIAKYHNKECTTTDDCGGLVCYKGTPNKCCMPEEANIAGNCQDDRRAQLAPCSNNEQCLTGYCSKGIEGFWQGLANPAIDMVNGFAHTAQYDLGADKKDEWQIEFGKCCPEGTDYDTATKSCIEGGTFSLEGDTEYCKEKKQKGFSCKDGQGNCEFDDECIGGSYCNVVRNSINICCPKGTEWDGNECKETDIDDCSLCGSDWFDSCDEDECFSIGTNCEFNEEDKVCYEKLSLKHEEGDCSLENSKGCYAPNEKLHCSVVDNYGVCCYPWEEQNPENKRCRTVCNNEFCDIDEDYYSSEVELKYGSNPMIKDDTPDVRVHTEECHTPFEYQRYSHLFGGAKRFIMFIISSVSGGILNSAVSSIASMFTEFSLEKPKVIWKAKAIGLGSGAAYGIMDDLNFASKIVTAPNAAKEAVEKFANKKQEVVSKNPKLEENLAQQYADEQLDSSIRNDMFSRTGQLSYESYDYHYKQDKFKDQWKSFWNIAENPESRELCLKQIHTKSFTTGFFGGFIWEQILLLGAVGGFLAKAGASLGSNVIKVAGKTIKFVDDPIKYGIVTPIKTLKSSVKLFSNFGSDGIKQIFKNADEVSTLTALEMASIIAKNKAVWNGLTATKFQKALGNFIALKNAMMKSLGDEAGAKAANSLLKTNIGKKIILEGAEQTGFNSKSAGLLAEAISQHGVKKIDNIFKSMSPSQIKKFGDEFSGLAGKNEDDARLLIKNFDEFSKYVAGVDIVGAMTGKQVADLFKQGASKDEIINALKKVKGVKDEAEIYDDVEIIPLKKIYGHDNKHVAETLAGASHQHQLDPIIVAKVGDTYLIDDGVGRTTRAFWKGETVLNARVMRTYESFEQMEILAKTNTLSRKAAERDLFWYTKHFIRIDSKQTMDLLEGTSKASDEVYAAGAKASDDVAKSAKKTGEEIIEGTTKSARKELDDTAQTLIKKNELIKYPKKEITVYRGDTRYPTEIFYKKNGGFNSHGNNDNFLGYVTQFDKFQKDTIYIGTSLDKDVARKIINQRGKNTKGGWIYEIVVRNDNWVDAAKSLPEEIGIKFEKTKELTAIKKIFPEDIKRAVYVDEFGKIHENTIIENTNFIENI